jgi:hypothetical protein
LSAIGLSLVSTDISPVSLARFAQIGRQVSVFFDNDAPHQIGRDNTGKK